jgi:hypothetical protein
MRWALIGEVEGRHVAPSVRIAPGVTAKRHAIALTGWAAVLSALFLCLGAGVAHADPSFVLNQAGAGPGDKVHFSISGMESRATYSLEVDGESAGEGTVAAGGSVSGVFTMPDLGDTAEEVTVEAQITQSDETTTRARTLQYVVSSQSGGQLAESQPPPVATSATPAAPADDPLPQSRQSTVPVSRPAAGKPRARHSPRPGRKRHAAARREGVGPPSTYRDSSRAPGIAASVSPAKASHQFAAAGGAGAKEHLSRVESQGSRQSLEDKSPTASVPARIASFLTGPPTPALFTFAAGVAAGGGSGTPIAALILFPLLGLTAVTLAGGGLAPRRLTPGVARVRLFLRPQVTEPVQAAGPCRSPAGRERMRPSAVEVPLEQAAAFFAPIPLALLERRAMLTTRSERKYILDGSDFGRLIVELVPHYLILEIDGARAFPYDTIYFDTPERTTYRQHHQGRRRRFKARTRLYPDGGLCFFEVKLKGGRGETIKRRLELGVEEHGSLTSRALAFLEHELREAYDVPAPAELEPALRTSYRRLTLTGLVGPERLTFDFELTFVGNGRERSIHPGRILLETKTESGLGEANRVLKRLGVRPVQSCSKYSLGVALTHPELPNNTFRPLIRRHFDPRGHISAGAYDLRTLTPPSADLNGDGHSVEREVPSVQDVLEQIARRNGASGNGS